MDDRQIKRYTNIPQEFRTLLILIAGPVNHLIKNNPTLEAADRLKLLKMVARNTKRLLRLVNQTLGLDKPDEKTLLASVNKLTTGRKNLRNFYLGKILMQEEKITKPNADTEFLQRCFGFVSQHLENPGLDSTDFCKYMGMSQAQLYRKLMALTGMPISDFIQSYRLRKAAVLLRSGEYTIAEVAYQVGFKDPSYFSKCFARHFGATPSQYLKVAGIHSGKSATAP
ncbi:MAG TPA: helix-turn-helix transcriptional regulator [Ohtaekwangia sp.]|nr:helix-turn-helix transcriptional regulator [Ohtaekwangia sp.]